MSDEELHEAALADPDNPPLTEQELERLKPPIQVKAIREQLGMTQREFASAYHLSLSTVRIGSKAAICLTRRRERC